MRTALCQICAKNVTKHCKIEQNTAKEKSVFVSVKLLPSIVLS